MKHPWRKLPVAVSLAAASLLSACDWEGGSSASGQGTLSVSLTDAPACGFDQVNVTVSKVRVHKNADASENDAGWSDIVLSQPTRINLLDLTNGVLQTLGQTTLPAGHYTQIRLVLDGSDPLANSVLPSGGTEVALATPSALQSGIKLNGQFDVAANSMTDIALDFDACKSVVKRGNGGYDLKPVISMIPMATSGAINGYVDPAVVAGKPFVSAQINGVIVKGTVPDSSGRFSLAPLVAGKYTVVITADARATDVIDSVPVSARAGTDISSSAAPIAMQPSAANTVSGIVSPASSQALVSAIQTFDTGQKITVRFVNADAQSGAYSMSVPTAAPSLGQYSATLPISLAQQAPIAGKYAIEAAASGYAGQSYLADLLNTVATVNFTF